MAAKLMATHYAPAQSGGVDGGSYTDWYCDTYTDLESIGEQGMGSTAYVIDTADVYVLNSSGTWCKV